jgi:DNA-binding GntR family transcriptional regulator
MVEHHRQGRRPGYFRLNQEIHLGLVAAAHNPPSRPRTPG